MKKQQESYKEKGLKEMINSGELCFKCGWPVLSAFERKEVDKDRVAPGYPRICQDCLDCEE